MENESMGAEKTFDIQASLVMAGSYIVYSQ